ncbi:MAG: succinylglutamate desuccinylase/aspartoacylase family protein [Idiomarina sp.]|nr:succinylglutamate desuccinylase/aspartoacylase family protein [Idiomarina sp.]
MPLVFPGPPLASLYHCIPLLTCLTGQVVLPLGDQVAAASAELTISDPAQAKEFALVDDAGALRPLAANDNVDTGEAPPSQATTAVTCDFSDVRFSAEFPQGRFGRCERGDDGRVIIHLEPEGTPINPSPWHAFTVEADSERTIGVEIRSEYADTRYSPKLSHDRNTWKVMEYEREGSAQFFTVEVGAEKVWIAGQELFDNNDYQIWLAKLKEQHPQLERIELGQSEEGRELPALVHYGSGNEWLLLLGRQHPPEITGAMAMRTFVETLLNDDELSPGFLARYNILIAPNLNPDGVAAGNWRHNANGVDLNRDWFSREQAETQAVHRFISDVTEPGGVLVYGIDFHSTFRDVFYTTPGDYLTKEPDFSFDWLNMLAAAVAPNAIREQPSANAAQGNFKQYMADTHGTHAVTYEVADNSDRLTIGLIATHGATTLMTYMIARPLPVIDSPQQ